MNDITAQIAGKGCNATGITEDLAKKLHDQLGRKVVAVVELVSEDRSEKRNGKEKVTLSILTIEPAPNAATEDHLRELARAFHYERKLSEDGPQLMEPGDGPAPSVSDVLQHGKGVLTVDDDGEARLFGDNDDLDAFPEPDDSALEPHTFLEGSIDDICAECEEPRADAIHTVDDELTVPDDSGLDDGDYEVCPAASCILPAEHDGDHGKPGDEAAQESAPDLMNPFATTR